MTELEAEELLDRALEALQEDGEELLTDASWRPLSGSGWLTRDNGLELLLADGTVLLLLVQVAR